MPTYFIADLHFGHTNLLRWEREGFSSIEEHDNFIITLINKRVKPTDILYILGDVGDVTKIPQINGRKIMIMGNHDKRSMKEYLGYFAEVYDHPVYLTDSILLSHYPVKVETHVLNVHGHLHGALLDSVNHVNVSAHMVLYNPLTMETIYQLAGKLPKRDISFLKEWYADMYVFTKPREDVITFSNGRVNLVETLQMRKRRGK